jgi:hypothetical protein
VSKRLKTVREELKANRKSIQEADAPLRLGSKAVNPQLLDGAPRRVRYWLRPLS